MRLVVLVVCIFALALPCAAQTTTDQAGQPAYLVGMGMGFSRADQPTANAGILFAMRAPNTAGTWATLEFTHVTAVTSSMQVGLLQELARKGRWSVLALGQAGGEMTPAGGVAAMFGGGGGMAYRLGGLWSKLDGLAVSGVVKAVKVNGTQVQLAFSGWLTKSF